MIPVWLFLGPCPWGFLVLSLLCWCPWSVLVFLSFYTVSWNFLLCWACMGLQWWCSFCCCLMNCCCCWWWWWWCRAGWGGWICVAIGWGPMLETDNVVVLSLCVGVPCPFCPVWRILFWPYVPGCCRHFVWQWCGGCCPNVGIDLCGWVSCKLWCWRCCLVVRWQGCPGMVVSLVVLVPLWTVCVGPGCWCSEVGPDHVLPCWWQRCHQQTLAKGKGDGGWN